MSYLPGFEYDVFLSYAHKDNETVTKDEEGWMTQFYKHFKLLLDRYLEGVNTAHIWCDHELRKNISFDDRIRNVLENSAIFLAFTSTSFYNSVYCCEKELSFFYNKAANNPLGLKVQDNSRIFQIQLLNKSYKLWPKEFQGIGFYQMFKYADENSLDKENDPGITLSYALDKAVYEKEIIKIVIDVCNTLKAIKAKQEKPVAQTKPSKIFFGNVAHTLISLREQIINELNAKEIPVFKCELPPPFEYDAHKEKVTEKLQESELAVHLFDEIAGIQISKDVSKSFLQEQALIGKGLNKEQLIFIPQELNLDTIKDIGQKQFLSDLLKNKLPESKYTLIKDFSVPSIIEHITTKLFPELVPPPENDCVLLDFNEVDMLYAVEYYNSIAAEKRVYLTTPGKSPIDFINSFDQALLYVKTVIIIWYNAIEEWIKQRIKDITCAIKTGRSTIAKVSIYKNAQLIDLDLATLSLMV